MDDLAELKPSHPAEVFVGRSAHIMAKLVLAPIPIIGPLLGEILDAAKDASDEEAMLRTIGRIEERIEQLEAGRSRAPGPRWQDLSADAKALVLLALQFWDGGDAWLETTVAMERLGFDGTRIQRAWRDPLECALLSGSTGFNSVGGKNRVSLTASGYMAAAPHAYPGLALQSDLFQMMRVMGDERHDLRGATIKEVTEASMVPQRRAEMLIDFLLEQAFVQRAASARRFMLTWRGRQATGQK